MTNASLPEDRLLVAQIARDLRLGAGARDGATAAEDAFAVLYERHARVVASVVYRLLGSDGEVDDVVQETFLDAAAELGALKDGQAVRSWLITVAVRRVHRLLRKRRRRAFLFSCFVQFSARTSDPRDRQAVDDLYDALDDLAPDLRVPWTLARIEELTLPEVARACEVSLATVKRRIALAEERLEKRLGQKLPGRTTEAP